MRWTLFVVLIAMPPLIYAAHQKDVARCIEKGGAHLPIFGFCTRADGTRFVDDARRGR